MKLFIVNDFDRPDERHIAEQRPDGKFYYIHPDLRDIKVYWGMKPDRPPTSPAPAPAASSNPSICRSPTSKAPPCPERSALEILMTSL